MHETCRRLHKTFAHLRAHPNSSRVTYGRTVTELGANVRQQAVCPSPAVMELTVQTQVELLMRQATLDFCCRVRKVASLVVYRLTFGNAPPYRPATRVVTVYFSKPKNKCRLEQLIYKTGMHTTPEAFARHFDDLCSKSKIVTNVLDCKEAVAHIIHAIVMTCCRNQDTIKMQGRSIQVTVDWVRWCATSEQSHCTL